MSSTFTRTRTSPTQTDGGTGVPPVKDTGPETSPPSRPTLRATRRALLVRAGSAPETSSTPAPLTAP